MDYSIFEISTGKITKSISTNVANYQPAITAGVEDYITKSTNRSTDYVTNTTTTKDIAKRPTQTTTLSSNTLNANGLDTINILNAPIGAEVTITNTVTGEVLSGTIDGVDDFATEHEGVYKIKISLWPYLDFEGIINAI